MPEGEDRGLWDGDRGTLSRDARGLLVTLVREACVTADDPRWGLVGDAGVREGVERDLADLGLVLRVDVHGGVAWAEQAGCAGIPLVKRSQPLTGAQTWLLCQLMRDQLASEAAGGTGTHDVPADDVVEAGRARGGPWESVLADEDAASRARSAARVLREQGYVAGPEAGPWHVTALARATVTLARAEGWLCAYEEAAARAAGRAGDGDDTDGGY